MENKFVQEWCTEPLTLENWKDIPVFTGRLATLNDLEEKKAIFCSIEAREKLCDLDLPFCAIFKGSRNMKKGPVVVVQAEFANNEVMIGAIRMNGKSLVCAFSELEIVNDPGIDFFSVPVKKTWWKFR